MDLRKPGVIDTTQYNKLPPLSENYFTSANKYGNRRFRITLLTDTMKRTINLIVIHCTASLCTSILTAQALDDEHRRRGFNGCGYHFYITQDGQVHPMRDTILIGAHAKGYNAHSIGIAYEGGLNPEGKPADTRTPQQRQALIALLRHLLYTYPGAHICGHRDLSPDLNGNGTIEPTEYIKICPCFDAAIEYEDMQVNS